MILEFDAGNTRIKWRLLKDTSAGLQKEAEGMVLAKKKTPSVFIELGLQLDDIPLAEIRKTRISSVREESFKTAFSSLMTEKWHLQPEYAMVSKSCGGVTNSYENVAEMGVDRWLAMLAAFEQVKGACCVVDCGSAITVDLVAESGRHLGGYIVPGLNLMQESLSRKSRALEGLMDNQAGWNSNQLGRNTKEAINNGVVNMVLGLVERVHKQYLNDVGSQFNWFVTGGDANIVSSLLDWDHKVVPDLVMDGLSVAMK